MEIHIFANNAINEVKLECKYAFCLKIIAHYRDSYYKLSFAIIINI